MKKALSILLFAFMLVLCGCAHSHNYTENVVNPTCTEQGYTEFVCECGEAYKDLYVEALGHSYGEWKVVKEATETKEGLKERDCSACNEKETEVIPMLDHTHSYTSIVTEPTCTEQGYTTYTCKCGDKYTDNKVDALGHSFGEWVVIKQPTVDETGIKERTCKCGEKETEELPKKPAEDGIINVGKGLDYETLTDALANAKKGSVIRLSAGEYNEDVNINIEGLTIQGPNYGKNANEDTRETEAVITGTFTITSAAKDLTIDGLAFTGNAKIIYNESVTYSGFTFINNKVYDTKEVEKEWNENRYETPGFIQFTLASGGTFSNVTIINNSFVNVSETNILANRVNNITVEGNVFKDFDVDAIRMEGGYCYGLMMFTNNIFEQTTLGNGEQAIFFYSIAGSSNAEKATVLVQNNKFIKIGNDNGTVFTGAIGAYRFQENITEFTIINNIFDHCYDYLYLRNNGGNNSTWKCTVENNQFLGLPNNQYYGSYRGTDTEATNPHLVKFTKNYYEDNNGKVINDLSKYASYFKHMSSYGTALTNKPADVVVEPVEFWSISYDLNGGTSKDAFIYSYNRLSEFPIVLPIVTKENCVFNGWLLNNELVTEIPAGTKGDLELMADFTVLEGEVFTVDFITNKENVIWPSRPAADRLEIIEELYHDLYEWAVDNGETRSYDAYVKYIEQQIAAYNDIKIRKPALGNKAADDGSTEYFLNIPKYHQKWIGFFEVFNEAMLKVNSGQVFYTDTYAAMVRLNQFITWSSTGQGYFSSFLTKMCQATKVQEEIIKSYRIGSEIKLPEIALANELEFLGWYDNKDFNGTPITKISSTDFGNKVFYAKWAEEVKAEKVEINYIHELLLFTNHQLVWDITPDNTTNKELEFISSNENVAKVSPKGLITSIATGTTTITVKVHGNRELDFTFELKVCIQDDIEGSYETNSYVEVGKTIKLNAKVNYKDGTEKDVKWTSSTPSIATVDNNGVVTAVAPGIAKIVAIDPNNDQLTLEFDVTVLNSNVSTILSFLLESHESNVFSRYNLGIGSGVPDYYKDIFGSVSKLLMDFDFNRDDSRKNTEIKNNTGDYYENMNNIEFVTVHYTGNMSSGADAKANANYFVDKNSVSIHYTTGNDGIFACLPHNYGGFHAGDSGAMSVVGSFKWIPSGVKVGTNDPQYPEFTISKDFYYEINGQKTSIKMPSPWDYKERGTNHTLNADGTISSKSNFGQSGFSNRTPESFINDQGLPFKIVNGEYYMGTTWWCYTQVYEGRICSTGGNRNSIGIESCVNKGSDLWYTWQITARLVAELMNQYKLDITRVRGHHFFTAKDCPQPMLENDLEIWKEFLALVETEYTYLTKFGDYKVEFKSNNPDIIDNNGRVIKQPEKTTCVTYTITVTKGGNSESITLSSIVPGMYINR